MQWLFFPSDGEITRTNFVWLLTQGNWFHQYISMFFGLFKPLAYKKYLQNNKRSDYHPASCLKHSRHSPCFSSTISTNNLLHFSCSSLVRHLWLVNTYLLLWHLLSDASKTLRYVKISFVVQFIFLSKESQWHTEFDLPSWKRFIPWPCRRTICLIIKSIQQSVKQILEIAEKWTNCCKSITFLARKFWAKHIDAIVGILLLWYWLQQMIFFAGVWVDEPYLHVYQWRKQTGSPGSLGITHIRELVRVLMEPWKSVTWETSSMHKQLRTCLQKSFLSYPPAMGRPLAKKCKVKDRAEQRWQDIALENMRSGTLLHAILRCLESRFKMDPLGRPDWPKYIVCHACVSSLLQGLRASRSIYQLTVPMQTMRWIVLQVWCRGHWPCDCPL